MNGCIVIIAAYINLCFKTVDAKTIYGEEDVLHPVFIFGVMKRGEPMHHWLENKENGECHFVSEAKTVQRFPMVIATEYNVPLVLYRPEEGNEIEGELYRMNLKMIKSLDRYEYLPNEVIPRIELVTYNDTDTCEVIKQPAIMYVKYYVDDDNLLTLPFISKYHSEGNHGLVFRERPIKQKKKRVRKKNNGTSIDGSKTHKKRIKLTASQELKEDIKRKEKRLKRWEEKYLKEVEPLLNCTDISSSTTLVYNSN